LNTLKRMKKVFFSTYIVKNDEKLKTFQNESFTLITLWVGIVWSLFSNLLQMQLLYNCVCTLFYKTEDVAVYLYFRETGDVFRDEFDPFGQTFNIIAVHDGGIQPVHAVHFEAVPPKFVRTLHVPRHVTHHQRYWKTLTEQRLQTQRTRRI